MTARDGNRPDDCRVRRRIPPFAALLCWFILPALLMACSAETSTPPEAEQQSTAGQATADNDGATDSVGDTGADQACDELPGEQTAEPIGLRPDVHADGNRLVEGAAVIDLQSFTTVDLPEPATWVLAAPQSSAADGPAWLVVLQSGEAVSILGDGTVQSAPAGPEGPPIVSAAGSKPVLEALGFERTQFTNPLPDTRVVSSGSWSAALVNPTDRYRHGVLGDDLEAAGVELLDRCTQERTIIDITAPDVIEGVAPLLVSADNSPTGDLLILVTVSNADVGARLVVFDRAGETVAESDPIGAGNRWRNQLAAGPIGPNGMFAVVDVRTPHIGGTVQWFALDIDAARLELITASEPVFTTHTIGSRNLDLGVAADVDGDSVAEVIVPSAQRHRLMALRPPDSGETLPTAAEVVHDLELPGRMTSNLGVQRLDGATVLALGTDQAQLLIFTP